MSYAVKQSKVNFVGGSLKVVAEVPTIEAGIEWIKSMYPGWNIYWEKDSDGFDAADAFIYKGAMSEVFSIEQVK